MNCIATRTRVGFACESLDQAYISLINYQQPVLVWALKMDLDLSYTWPLHTNSSAEQFSTARMDNMMSFSDVRFPLNPPTLSEDSSNVLIQPTSTSEYNQILKAYFSEPAMAIPNDMSHSQVSTVDWSPVSFPPWTEVKCEAQNFQRMATTGNEDAVYSLVMSSETIPVRTEASLGNQRDGDKYYVVPEAFPMTVLSNYESSESLGVSAGSSLSQSQDSGIVVTNQDCNFNYIQEETVVSDNSSDSISPPHQFGPLEGTSQYVFSSDEVHNAYRTTDKPFPYQEFTLGNQEQLDFENSVSATEYKVFIHSPNSMHYSNYNYHCDEEQYYDTVDGSVGVTGDTVNFETTITTSYDDGGAISPTPGENRDFADPDWTAHDLIPPKKKRKYTRKPKSSENSNLDVQDKKASKKSEAKSSARNTGDCNKRRKEKDKNRSSITTVGRPKVDVNSFRYKMGPHLRSLAAMLEISGMKFVSDSVPYELIKRFHPTDMFRSIEKIIAAVDNFNKEKSITAGEVVDVEPDWTLMESVNMNAQLIKADVHSTNSAERLYYTTPFGKSDADPLTTDRPGFISMSVDTEEKGRLKCSPEILTAVGSANLSVDLNLHAIAEKCPNTEIKDVDGPLTMRLKHPKCTGLLFKSGKLIVIGPKSFDEFRVATRRLARMVQKTGPDVKLRHLQLHFYIGCIKLPFEINVAAMMKHNYLSQFIQCDPLTFSGVVFRMTDSPILCIVFSTGAIIMTEALGEEDMRRTLDKIYPTLRLFGHQF